MALAFLNRCIWLATSGGSGSFVVASAVTGYQAPEDCLAPVVVDGATYRYFAQSSDLTQWEAGYGVYTTADDTLTRAVVLDSSNAGSIVTFSAAPSVFMGGTMANDIAFRGIEHVTTDNTTPKDINPDVLITYITTDGSGLEQAINLPVLPIDKICQQHLIILLNADQTDPADIVVITGSREGDTTTYLDPSQRTNPRALFQRNADTDDGQWQLMDGYLTSTDPNLKAFVIDTGGSSFFINSYSIVSAAVDSGNLEASAPWRMMASGVDLVVGWRDRSPNDLLTYEDVTVGSGAPSTGVFRSLITSDGSAGPQAVNISGGVTESDGSGQIKLLYFAVQTDPADVLTVTADEGIVGSEVITLTTVGSWALFMLTADGWLPWTFGGGTTTDATGNRTLQLADTGGLSWV